jgi:hypothetical protein
MNGTDSNLVLKWILDLIKESVPKNIIHPCPYYGEFVAYNVSLGINAQLLQFLSGRYRSIGRFFDDQDENIFTFVLGVETY